MSVFFRLSKYLIQFTLTYLVLKIDLSQSQLIDSRYYTPALLIINGPQPDQNIAADQNLQFSLEVTGDGKLPPASTEPGNQQATTILSLSVFLINADLNMTVFENLNLLEQERGSSVKHLNFQLPSCTPSGTYQVIMTDIYWFVINFSRSHIMRLMSSSQCCSPVSKTNLDININNSGGDSSKTCQGATPPKDKPQDSRPPSQPFLGKGNTGLEIKTDPMEAPAGKPVDPPTAKPVDPPSAKPVDSPAAQSDDAQDAQPDDAQAAQPNESQDAKPNESQAAKPNESQAAKPNDAGVVELFEGMLSHEIVNRASLVDLGILQIKSDAQPSPTKAVPSSQLKNETAKKVPLAVTLVSEAPSKKEEAPSAEGLGVAEALSKGLPPPPNDASKANFSPLTNQKFSKSVVDSRQKASPSPHHQAQPNDKNYDPQSNIHDHPSNQKTSHDIHNHEEVHNPDHFQSILSNPSSKDRKMFGVPLISSASTAVAELIIYKTLYHFLILMCLITFLV
ncbi:hypothetical protein DFH28DRAFT_1083005 [Melampsora americana]|nr:hypothetical protein DFH28DRAFT_1083005 [Melampsora americana]